MSGFEANFGEVGHDKVTLFLRVGYFVISGLYGFVCGWGLCMGGVYFLYCTVQLCGVSFVVQGLDAFMPFVFLCDAMCYLV